MVRLVVAVARTSRLRRSLNWCLSRKLEVSIFALGVLLRASMRFSFHPEWSYDADRHWEVVEWIAKHHRVPPVEAVPRASSISSRM